MLTLRASIRDLPSAGIYILFTARKAREKLDYMHLNPVRAALVERAVEWRWISAAWREKGAEVGIPLAWIFEE